MQSALLAREIEVLKIIIEDYISTSQPVGSRTVAKQSRLRLSPASMRNVMADLTDKGFLEQPHTSAGRVPTALAFRYYLDTELLPRPLTSEQKQRISEFLSHAGLELADILSQATRMLSSFSHQIAMVMAPNREDVRWREIDFALIKPGLVLAVLILDGGIVQNRLVETEETVTRDDLVAFSNYLNDNFQGLSLAEVRGRIERELELAERQLQKLYSRALRLARNAFERLNRRELFVEGTTNILDQIEFSDVARLREILHVVEERTRLLDLLDRTIAEKGVQIVLGEEAELEDLRECGVITSPYGEQAHSQGVVGVIGPIRMDYARIVPVVDYVARTLTHILKNRF